ncbi:hypothetical protein [Carnobacterium funditum]|uniref:hypothetical protein n=1 Tax=Carnobacterium funditum TaxID=2752 RepID=UPI00054E69C2|nr:hypothetical protein [Carnobacterium funditum]
MSLEQYSVIINAPLKKSIKIINDPNFWLPFLPGFNQLTSVSDCTYLVDLFLSLGSVARKTLLTFHFETKTKTKTNNVHFTFSSTNKHISGLGELSIYQYSKNKIQLKVSLDLRLKGRKSLLFTPLLPSVKKTWAKNILNEVKNSLESEQ